MYINSETMITVTQQGWAVNTTPGIYHWYLPVFTGMENTPQSGKYWKISNSEVGIYRFLLIS